MNRVILKYPLEPRRIQEIFFLHEVEFLSTGVDRDDKLCVWVMHSHADNLFSSSEYSSEDTVKTHAYSIMVIGTGEDFFMPESENWKFLGTAFFPPLPEDKRMLFHVFVRKVY